MKTKAKTDDGPTILPGPWARGERLLRELAKARNISAIWTYRNGAYVRLPISRLGA